MIQVNDTASVTRCFEAPELAQFAKLCAGNDPEHVPLPVIFSLFSLLLGEHLPGRGTMYLKQTGALQRRIAPGETLTASVRVTRLRPDKGLVDLATVCVDEAGRVCCSGRALVLATHAFEN